MVDPEISGRMRSDWNERAREDAGYYVAFGRRQQDDEEFFATAKGVVTDLERELRRFPASTRPEDLRALEIGCGPGRIMRPMSPRFAEIHGVDVSDEMIRLAREKLHDVPNAYPHHTDGASLVEFGDASFDLVYSYAVFQHIPDREVVLEYLRETHRVLKVGGLFRAQFNGLPQMSEYDTWNGVRLSAMELMEFARRHDFQVLAVEGVLTQYMWITWRKRAPGWEPGLLQRRPKPQLQIRRITNAESYEPVVPSRGRFAAISLWAANLPEECGLQHLEVFIGSSKGTVTYIGPPDNSGLQQVNVILPPLEATGLLPVEIFWLENPLCPPATLRVIPPGPQVPRVLSVCDGINLLAGIRIETRTVKINLEEVLRPDEFSALIDGQPVVDVEIFCTDPRSQRFEVNFRIPEEVPPGPHQLQMHLGRRRFAPIHLEVA